MKKVLVYALSLIFILMNFSACTNSNESVISITSDELERAFSENKKDVPNIPEETNSVISFSSTVTSSEPNSAVSQDDFVNAVSLEISGAVGKDEKIEDVILDDVDLSVYVDISNADPYPLTYEDLVLSRTSSITDDILKLKEYYDFWETITVDFGPYGSVKNNKDDIKHNEDGGAYFPLSGFVID